MVVHSLTDSDDQLINSPIECSDSEAPTSISNLSRDDVETDLKGSSDGSNKVGIMCLFTSAYLRCTLSVVCMWCVFGPFSSSDLNTYVGIYICDFEQTTEIWHDVLQKRCT